jgi:hypothetical protein
MPNTDNCLICFFSWGRRDLTTTALESLLDNVRLQDRIAVFDQGMHNLEYFATVKDKIDFLFTTKLNYEIGPAWMFFKQLYLWIKGLHQVFRKESEDRNGFVGERFRGWKPDYICIYESDAVGKPGWINKVVGVYKGLDNVGIASGYGGDHFVIERKNITYEEETTNGVKILANHEVLIKDVICGVNQIIPADYFCDLFETLFIKGQDWAVSKKNKENGRLAVVVPDEVRHIGEGMGRTEGFKR